MKRTALLVAAVVMILMPAQAQSQEYGHWEVRVVGYNQDGRPRYARVYCRSDGYCYRPRRYGRPAATPRVSTATSGVRSDARSQKKAAAGAAKSGARSAIST